MTLRNYLFSLYCLASGVQGDKKCLPNGSVGGISVYTALSPSCQLYLPDSRKPRGHSEGRYLGRYQPKVPTDNIYESQSKYARPKGTDQIRNQSDKDKDGRDLIRGEI